jgi:hypothetical protein
VEVLARAASEDAAWLAFQRMSAWWLGEHANVAANEFAGTSGMEANTFEEQGVIQPPSGRVEIATHNKPLSAGEVRCLQGSCQTARHRRLKSTGYSATLCELPAATRMPISTPMTLNAHLNIPAPQVIALQASENPAMMAVVSQLQHAVLTMPWEVRIAAAQAIAKVSLRSIGLENAAEPAAWHCLHVCCRYLHSFCKYSQECPCIFRSGCCAIRGAIPHPLLQHIALTGCIRPCSWQ